MTSLTAFLLESVERGEQIGRYTFMGARPYMRVEARASQIEIVHDRARGKRKSQALRKKRRQRVSTS